MSLGRIFRIKERATVNLRVEFANVFNRARVQEPVANNALATQQRTNGQTTAGFGYINTTFGSAGAVNALQFPRTGTIIGRFQF